MRILVTGRAGQVATGLAERAALHPDIEVIAVGRPELDLAAPATIAPAIVAARPDVVVSAAAWTAVDAAEDAPDAAFAANATGAGAVAAAAAALGVPVIHLSTDYVFDGTKPAPYVETDPTSPLGVYGASKLAGEAAVAAANPRHLILRTAWVYAPFGHNFVRTMLRLATTRDGVDVVGDQIGCPTSAFDLAHGILIAARALLGGDSYGVYHLAGSDETSWAGFARYVFAVSAAAGGPAAAVREITTADYPTRARRPANSRLDSSRFAARFGWRSPAWQEAVAVVVRRLVANA